MLPQHEPVTDKDASLLGAESGQPRHNHLYRNCSVSFFFRVSRILVGRLLIVLTPSFLQRHHHKHQQLARDDNFSTAWLDGIRGLASFCVFLFHHSRYGHPNIKIAYGGSDEQQSLIQLPIIRLAVHGRTMVALFFIVSGYALSVSPLRLIRQRDYETLARRLSSSVFRRGIRLMLPSFVAACMHYAAQRAGLVRAAGAYSSTFWNDTRALLSEFFGSLVNPFTWSNDVVDLFYGPQLWTIPIEFRASMLLFVTLLGLARAVTAVRLSAVAFLCVYSMAVRQWDVSLFMSGVLIADHTGRRSPSPISFPSTASSPPPSPPLAARSRPADDDRTPLPPRRTSLLLSGLLLFGLYLGSYPTQRADTTNVYKWLYRLGPADADFKSRLWTSVGAALAVAATSFLTTSCCSSSSGRWWCCRAAVLESRPVQYLGRISYALYLTHYLLNDLVGRPLTRFVWDHVGVVVWLAYEGGWLVATALYVPLVIWVADVFWRVVDVRSVAFAREVERWCTRGC
ncbi:acyltransferase 3 [Microdochium trichocladiopsis]|uniref:Acyltransferase 3 n=1 Tax=Microdochium trichocladiopsis TaxID=1682393 RepID=A0A9P8YK33_9PEZI|nr:acyltransferase 3 [Microdochium trichocladiopsis]KAH7041407.1 acyltransferase 3 [Microdochium trichocladiopsis]